jgi:hypothetical protein
MRCESSAAPSSPLQSESDRIPAQQRNNAMCHGTKSLRDSPLRG